MNQILYNITLDAHKGGIQQEIKVKREETGARYLMIRLEAGGLPYVPSKGTSAQLRAIKPDGTKVYNACVIDGNMICTGVTTQMAALEGFVRCELSIVGPGGEVLYSPQFEMLVEDHLYDDDGIESTDEYTELSLLIAKVYELLNSDELRGPQGEQGPKGEEGEAGAVFIPSLSLDGLLSWSNNGSLDNPEPVNIRGPRGEAGPIGPTGPAGKDGAVKFEDLTDEQIEILRGPTGATGLQGDPGPQGEPGPNRIDESTETVFSGLLKGNGANVVAATPGEDYAAGKHAEAHAKDGADPLNPESIGALSYDDIAGQSAEGTLLHFDNVFPGTHMEQLTLHGRSTQAAVPGLDVSIPTGKNLLNADAFVSRNSGTFEVSEDGYNLVVTGLNSYSGIYYYFPVDLVAGKEIIAKFDDVVVDNYIGNYSVQFVYQIDGANTYVPVRTNDKIATVSVPEDITWAYITILANNTSAAFESAQTVTVKGLMLCLAENDDLSWEAYQGGPVEIEDLALKELEVWGDTGAAVNYPVNLTLPGIPVDSGGNYTDENGQQYIADTYDVVTGEYVQRVCRHTITGADDFKATRRNDGTYRHSLKNLEPAPAFGENAVTGKWVLCTHLPTSKSLGLWDGGVTGIALARTLPDIVVYIPNIDTDDVSAIKAYYDAQYAAGTPVTVLYALSEPIITYKDPQEVLACDPTTNISSGGAWMVGKTGNALEAQDVITATGLLKGNGEGDIVAAVAGVDYTAPETVATLENLFLAVYGETPFAEVYAAGQAGKSLLCSWNGNLLYFRRGYRDEILGYCILFNGVFQVDHQFHSYNIRLCENSGWEQESSYITFIADPNINGLVKVKTENGYFEQAEAGVDYISPPVQITTLPESGTALAENHVYTVEDAVGSYVFTPPASGWAHGTFSTSDSVAVSFAGSFAGAAPSIKASKTYEFDVLNAVWAVLEVVHE